MAGTHTGNIQPGLDLEEHRSVNGVNAKAVASYAFNGTDLVPFGGGLIPNGYDYISIPSYNANNDPLTVIYKVGGSAGVTVATLTITYDASNNVTSVART